MARQKEKRDRREEQHRSVSLTHTKKKKKKKEEEEEALIICRFCLYRLNDIYQLTPTNQLTNKHKHESDLYK